MTVPAYDCRKAIADFMRDWNVLPPAECAELLARRLKHLATEALAALSDEAAPEGGEKRPVCGAPNDGRDRYPECACETERECQYGTRLAQRPAAEAAPAGDVELRGWRLRTHPNGSIEVSRDHHGFVVEATRPFDARIHAFLSDLLAQQPAVAPASDWVDEELRDVDALLRRLGLEPEDARTDGGRLRVSWVVEQLAALASPTVAPVSGDGDSRNFGKFSTAGLVKLLAEWAADQRGREAWNDGDRSTYRYRAGLLQAGADRLAALASPTGVDEAKDAARWRAVIGSARVRMLGSVGLISDTDPSGKPHGNYAHIGLELWTLHPAEANEPPNAIEWLTKYADKAVAALAARDGGAA